MNYTVADGAKLLSAKMKRFIEFDVLRGVLLLMMSVDHSPSLLRRFTDQPLGFFSTAECFVFVSAFLAGMLFRKRAEKLGFAAARSSSIHRAGRIYRAHLVTFPSALDGHPPDVRPILFSHTCCFRSGSTMGMEDGPFCQLFGLDHRADTCQGYVGKCIQRSFVRPTRSVRSSRLAVSMGRRAVHRPAFSGKQGPAADASSATTALSPLGDRVSFLALDFYHERPRSNYSNMVVR